MGHSRAVENGLPPCLMYMRVCVYVRGAHCPVRTVQYGTVQYCTVLYAFAGQRTLRRVSQGFACARGLGVACSVEVLLSVDPQAV